jgi:1-acyl-sn-glycerol-3-phosphate acyltransferase
MKDKTRKKASKLLESAFILLFAYPSGLIVSGLGLLGKFCRCLKILHSERLACLGELDKVILVANHPSVIDPFLVAIVISWYYIKNPLRHAPLIVADRLHFYNSWWFWPFRSVMVPVDRDGDKKKASAALLRIMTAVGCGRPLIIFPEGGRTFKGNDCEFLYGQKGAKIRFLQKGIGLLVRRTEATVIPIDIYGSDKVVPNSKERLFTKFVFWKKTTVVVGNPLKFDPKATREHVTQEIASQLLKLIDEASAHCR